MIAGSGLMNARRVATVLILTALASSVGCQGGESPFGSVLEANNTAHEPVVSEPQPSVAAVSAAAFGSTGQAVDPEIVFVSLPPGTIPSGGFATISDARTGVEASAAMAQGGFDPVPLVAAVGDTVAINVRLEGGGTQVLRLVVPVRRRPVVVRADPPPRKRDVPLNSVIVVVFSEPIQATSASQIQVLQNGSPVNGTASVSADGLRAEFRPAQLLSPNADYVLSVRGGVTDLTGDQMGAQVTAAFTTGTTSIVASVATDPVALLMNPFSQTFRTFEMRAILDDAGQVTGTFSGFYPQTGLRWSGRVTCFAIVGGDSAWVGGVIETSSTPGDNGIGQEGVWRAVDNGTPSPTVHDQLSLMLSGLEPGAAHDWCANTPPVFPDSGPADLIDVQSGNIVVNPSGGPPPPPPPPPPPLPPDPSRVSQVAFFTPYEAILAMNVDATGLRTVTAGPRDDNPAWSPDARKIAFQSDRSQQNDWDIYVVNWDGSGLQHLTSGPETDQDPAWSRDGSRIAFLRNGSIHVMNANGTGVRRLSFTCCDSHPSWSPDGSRIVFASARSGVNAIYVMNADGSSVVQLTTVSDYSPTWSPDGTRISFARKFERKADGADEGLYIMNADGSGLTQLTLGINGPASWAPDGTRLVYELFGMNLIKPDGTGIMRIGQGFNPVWSPVGTVPAAPVPFRSIEMVSGDAQTGVVGDTLAQQLRVRVLDDSGTPQSGVSVRWNVWGPGAGIGVSLAPMPLPSTTDSAGYSSVWVTLSGTAGAVRMRAAVVDGTARKGEVVFTATAVPKP
jgi:Tol biopolymer transport system component